MINPETEIVSTAHNAKTRVHSFTIERDGKRYTAHIPDADFQAFGPVLGASAATNKINRRRHLAMRLEAAMQGKADV